MVWIDNSSYLLENISCTKGTTDELTFAPRSLKGSDSMHSLKFTRGDLTSIRAMDPIDYSISFVNEFYNSPFVGRLYTFTSGQHEKGAEIELYVSDDYDDLIVETYDTPFSFTVTTKSTESFDNDPDIDYIPESKGDFTMDANSKMVVSPEDWATTKVSGVISLGDTKQQDDTSQTPGFELTIVLFAIILGILFTRKRKRL
jgi:hypothetical protein